MKEEKENLDKAKNKYSKVVSFRVRPNMLAYLEHQRNYFDCDYSTTIKNALRAYIKDNPIQ